MARSAADLSLLLDVIAGPDGPVATAYRLALPPSRRDDLKSFRVIVLDTHPLAPTASSVRTVVERLAERLAKTGATVVDGQRRRTGRGLPAARHERLRRLVRVDATAVGRRAQ